MILELRRNLDLRAARAFTSHFTSPSPSVARRSRSILSSSRPDCRVRKHRHWLAGEFTSHGAFVLAPPRIKEILSLLRHSRCCYVAINEFVMRRSSRPGVSRNLTDAIFGKGYAAGTRPIDDARPPRASCDRSDDSFEDSFGIEWKRSFNLPLISLIQWPQYHLTADFLCVISRDYRRRSTSLCPISCC